MPALIKISDGAISTTKLFTETNNLLFEIKPPQRRFKWTKRQVDQLWNDIHTAYSTNRDSYFLGSLLLVQSADSERVEVIDGQQRITTLSILLAVLRDQCQEFPGLSSRANTLQRHISRVDHDDRPVGALVVKLQDPDDAIYEKLVRDHGSTATIVSQKDPPLNDLLSKAARTLTEHVKKFLEPANPEHRLREFCNFVQDNVRFLPLEVRNEAEAYLVFDTTNTRGMRLSPSEALKGRLATKARENSDLSARLISKWNVTARNLENAGLSINAMDNYLHSVWSAREGYTKKSALDRISEKLSTNDDFKNFIDELEAYSSSYITVAARKEDSSLFRDLRDLRNLNVQCYSFLTMVHKHTNSRFKDAVDLVLTLQIRNVTIGNYQANDYEKDWPKWAGLVREGKLQQAFDEIRSKIISDDEFRRSFEKKPIPSAIVARHLLRRLEAHSVTGSGMTPFEVDVEHVMPKSLVGKLIHDKKLTKNAMRWLEDLEIEIPLTTPQKLTIGKNLDTYLNMLGNQALLNITKNRGAKDLRFSEKTKLYDTQALDSTKSLTLYGKWGPKQIEARQRDMAQRAPSIWAK